MFKFFKKIKLNKKDKQKGIALVIAVTTMTLLLSLSLSISNIVLRQIKIANINNYSKPTFFAADSAMECVFYYDTKFLKNSLDESVDDNLEFETSIFGSLADEVGKQKIKDNVKCGKQVLNVAKSGDNSSMVSNLDIDYDNYCAKVTVTKTQTGTQILSRGYNTKADASGCDLTNIDTRRLVERGLFIKY